MKKLMIAAGAAAMIAGAYANTCVTTVIKEKDPCTGEVTKETVTGAATAHKVAISLKTTTNKGKTSKRQCEDATCTYWRQQATKKINGYIYAQLNDCGGCTMNFDGQSVALWTKDGAVDAEFGIGVGFIGSKTNSKSVEAYGTLAGDDFGELAFGAFGTVVSKVNKVQCEDDECSIYVKSLTGGIAGKLVPAEWDNPCVDCDLIAYEGCCDDAQLEYTAAYGTIKISYDTAMAKKIAVAEDADEVVASVKGAPGYDDAVISDVAIEE